jgi:flagellar hook-length control protein FliK
MLRDAAAARAAAPAHTAPAHRKDTMNDAGRGAAADDSRARPARRQNLTAGADTNAVAAEAPAHTAPAHGEDAVNETGCGAAADDSHTQPTRRSAANDTEDQPVWALLAQIIQNLTAAADTNAVAVAGQGAGVASDPEAGAAAENLAALVDLLKQLQESPAALTAESAISLDRLRQMLEQWQAGANESQPTGLSGRLLDLLKNVQDALPGIAWDRWAGAMASQGGVLLDAKATQVAAGQAEAAVGADELSDSGRPAADARGPGAGRVMPAAPTAASPPAETLRSTAVSSQAQASEGSCALPRNFETSPDTQSEVADDSRSPAEKATAGLALSAADQVAEEGGSPGLRFEAALRDVRSFAVPEGSPDKPAEAAAAAKGRDTAAAPVKTDVFDQIVQRAAVHVKNDQGEIRIDLKPEFLGHVRLQIVTENQQVTVRILTELPMVRDMIESSIQQLKSDLQQQGLRVERVEVAVADDPRQQPGRQAWTGAGRKGHADGDVAPAAAETSAGLRPEAAYRWGLGGQTTINMFA